MSFARIFQKIQNQLRSDQPAGMALQGENGIRLATAGLLLDVAHADEEFSDRERSNLTQHLQTQFGLDEESTRELILAADEARNQTIDHFAFANLIRTNVALEQRLEILRTMWRIVFADGALSLHEEYLIKKLSELLGIERHIMIEEKLRIKQELGLKSS
jgi:uncharacterized tellurite resistance protein B-like protein